MKVLLIGYGRVNKEFYKKYKSSIVGIVSKNEIIRDKPDIVIDFSNPLLLEKSLSYAKEYNVPLLIGTTGYKEEDFNKIKEASKIIPILYSSNFSFLMNYLFKFFSCNNFSSYDKEITEIHHKKKLDKISGTALNLAKILDVYKVKSKRVEDLNGIHEVKISNSMESLIITHEAKSLEVYVTNAYLCGVWLLGKKSGYFKVEDYLDENL